MRSIVYHAPKDVRVEDLDVPEAGAGELRVKVDACAVCGSDMKSYNVGNPRMNAPVVMGHEFTGRIDQVGEGVTGFEKGDRVVMATSVACGDCYYCRQGWRNICANIQPMGFFYHGGMAEYTVIPELAITGGHVIKVPEDVAPEHAALAEPVSCAVNSCEQSQVQEGDTVVIVGAGPMGILNACVAREFGAAKIILSEVNELRLKQAEPFGFDRLVNPTEEDLAEIVMNETEYVGADVAIVCAPAAKPQEDAVFLVHKRGTVCLFASLPAADRMITLDSRAIHYGELRIVGTSDSTPEHVTKAVELIAGGKLPCERIASHILTLDDFEKAIELMKSGEALRVVLKP